MLPRAIRRRIDNAYLEHVLKIPRAHLNGSQEPGETAALVSFVVPVYDRTDLLRRSVHSLLHQTYGNIEVILVTDGSPPETLAVVEELSTDPRVRVFHYEDNSGNAIRGRNRGIQEARGAYIAFHDSDDIADPNRVLFTLRIFAKTRCAAVYGDWKRRFEDGAPQRDEGAWWSDDFNIASELRENILCQSAVTVRRDALLDVGGLKPSMEYREDHELWCRLAFFGYRFEVLHKPITTLCIHGGNNENRFIKETDYWRRKMLQEYTRRGSLPLSIGCVVEGDADGEAYEHVMHLGRKGHRITFIVSDPGKVAEIEAMVRRLPMDSPEMEVAVASPHLVRDTAFDVCIAASVGDLDMLEDVRAHHKIFFHGGTHCWAMELSDNDLRSLSGTVRTKDETVGLLERNARSCNDASLAAPDWLGTFISDTIRKRALGAFPYPDNLPHLPIPSSEAEHVSEDLPPVDIVIPCYNHGKYLMEAVRSALGQTYPNTRVIVVDDASTDPYTKEVMQNLPSSVTLVRNPKNKGLSGARNAGIAASRKGYILPLDADDRIDSQYVAKAVQVFQSDPSVGIVYSQGTLFGERRGPWNLPKYTVGRELYMNCIHCSALFAYEDWQKVGGYDESIRTLYEDWDFWLTLIGAGCKVRHIKERLFHYRIRGKSMSRGIDPMVELHARTALFTKHHDLYVRYAAEFLAYIHGQHFDRNEADLLSPVEKELHELRRSLSVRVGFLVTAPARMVYEGLRRLW